MDRGARLGAEVWRRLAAARTLTAPSRALLGVGGEDWASASRRCSPERCPARYHRATIASPRRFPIPSLPRSPGLPAPIASTAISAENDTKPSRLVLPDGVDRARVLALAEAIYFARDLINTPANDFGPAELESAAREIGTEHGATIKVTEGSSLLSDNFPMIHAVGRASDRAPRLIDLRWGSEHAPKVTIVGKGICFDTGGLDIKPWSAMALMKKDMGGAASALAFAHLVMRRSFRCGCAC